MTAALDTLTAHLLGRLDEVRDRLGLDPAAADSAARFADLLDSMGMVEFLALVGDDCGVPAEALERCAGQRFGTVAELAGAMFRTGIVPRRAEEPTASSHPEGPPEAMPTAWLTATAARLPGAVQPAEAIDAILGRPAGWLGRHAGIRARRLWAEEDPLDAAAEAARQCLDRVGLLPEEVGALLTTSEAPPLLAGLAAALHHRLALRPQTVALEVGGACTGFLAALWLARQLAGRAGPVLITAVEAPSRFLTLAPGPAGEAAALFGDGTAACLVGIEPAGDIAVPLRAVTLLADGASAGLLRVQRTPGGAVELVMDGPALAGSAVRAMADAVRDLTAAQGLAVADLEGVVAHGGNGRMPALLARQLGLPPGRVWSEAADLGNLGSVSLPVAWAARGQACRGPVVWVAAGAGLTVAAALTGTS